MSKKPYYITTPLYYVNGKPHIGHAYTTILADVLARYQRTFNRDVYFLSGLDEHGQKVAAAADKNGVTPQEHVDLMATEWENIWRELLIEYDDFIRTTEPRHERVVVDILNQLYNKGDIYRKEYVGWYSVYEERFFTEKDLIDGLDPIGRRPVEWIKELNYFFRMSRYQQWLIDHYEAHPNAVIPQFRLNEVKGFLRQPLGDLCISRPKSRLSWGIPIPWDADYVTYVWFDALINYYSATLNPPRGARVSWPADYHLIGKDILTTHAVYWPIMLHAAGLEPPRQILAHGWWLARDDSKMAKSSSNYVDPLDMVDRIGPDAFRYVLMREMAVGQDAKYSEETIVSRINTDLANDLGNLYSRLAKLWKTGGFGAQEEPESTPSEISGDLAGLREELDESVRRYIEAVQPNLAIDHIMELVRALNRFIEILKPWNRVKTDPAPLKNPLAWALAALDDIAASLAPVMPSKMADLRGWIRPDGARINPVVGKQLFPRIRREPSTAKQAVSKRGKKTGQDEPAGGESTADIITIKDFNRIKLKVGRILSARKVEGADKLLELEIDIGGSTRRIVSGIAGSYDPEHLPGKSIVIIMNLKAAKVRGIMSDGMLLAAESGDEYRLVTVDGDVKPGARVS